MWGVISFWKSPTAKWMRNEKAKKCHHCLRTLKNQLGCPRATLGLNLRTILIVSNLQAGLWLWVFLGPYIGDHETSRIWHLGAKTLESIAALGCCWLCPSKQKEHHIAHMWKQDLKSRNLRIRCETKASCFRC